MPFTADKPAGNDTLAVSDDAIRENFRNVSPARDLFSEGFVQSGIETSINGTNQARLDVTAGIAYVKQTSSGDILRYDKEATFFTTSVASTTYYLDLNEDGTYNWAETHSSDTNYLPIAEVTTDSNGDISTVSDKRYLTPRIKVPLNAVYLQTFGAVGDGSADDTQPFVDAVNYADRKGIKYILGRPGDIYKITEHLSFGSETTGVIFDGLGAVINTENVGTASPKQAKIEFNNCNNVEFKYWEIVGNITSSEASGGDDVAQVTFKNTTSNCKMHDNIIRGVDGSNLIHHGISFYSENGECYSNLLQNGRSFGFIIINDPANNSWINIHHNVVDGFSKHFEPAYASAKINIHDNISLNPSQHHFTLWAKEGTGQHVEDIKIINNLCINGGTFVSLELGEEGLYSGGHIENVDIRGNEMYNIGNYVLAALNSDGDYFRNIDFVDNHIEITDNTVDDNILYFNTGYGDVPVENLTVRDNYFEGLSALNELVNFFNGGSNLSKNIKIVENTFNNIGTSSTSKLIFFDNVESFTFRDNKFENKGSFAYTDIDIDGASLNYGYIGYNQGLESVTCSTEDHTLEKNPDLITENKGTATITTGNTSVTVSHGLDVSNSGKSLSFSDIQITPTNNLGSATQFWIGTVSSTDFTIKIDSDPGVDANFSWQAEIN